MLSFVVIVHKLHKISNIYNSILWHYCKYYIYFYLLATKYSLLFLYVSIIVKFDHGILSHCNKKGRQDYPCRPLWERHLKFVCPQIPDNRKFSDLSFERQPTCGTRKIAPAYAGMGNCPICFGGFIYG